MSPVEDQDQTVIVATHPRGSGRTAQPAQVTVLGTSAGSRTMQAATYQPSPRNAAEPRQYLIDMHPEIHGGTSRYEIRPGTDPQDLAKPNTTDYLCWKFIQFWRRCMHGAIRMKFKRRCWHQMSELLKMWKARGELRTHHLLKDVPTAFPNARLIDRQSPVQTVGATASSDPQGSYEARRHRILLH